MKLAALQLRATDDRTETIGRAADLIDAAADQGTRILLLPELFAVPFVQPEPDLDYFRYAEGLDGPSNRMAAERSKRHRMTVVSSIFEAGQVPGVYHNTACTYVDGELKSVYRKSHLPFSNGFPEKFYFQPGGTEPDVVQTGETGVGTIICYERHFPELSRVVALRGGSVLCVPVASASAPMREVFQLELRAHAVFNGLFVICANRVGTEGTKEYFGLSAVYGPNGDVLAQAADDRDDIAVAEVDLDLVDLSRRRRPFLRDRRPELYGRLTRMEPET
ncbi:MULTISPECIES: nitrilase-related carbon-nitrogen hydrolase [unclassified Micromonospora]|uniref:nitrilase-related carbon-nitrogen hydrolase n=1 Tax=unclassified Micromonospora TaxID=2617518 RepID=UPI0010339F9D|nr:MULTISPECIES: nitrilase-related carbon-nitrogen hydrolase [unclassified Micromonospora]QKW13929.1 carbon-nitrogen hydrolase family protein [Verrucosispora sp. NA02020]TBL36422.1 carbon-nitrogen hydrolase family protein [Verrucosispora sp. SN26_14.1]